MTEPTPRQVLYALVSGGFLVSVAVLVIGAALAEIAPTWWTLVLAVTLVSVAIWAGFNWRKTAQVLSVTGLVFLAWAVGTLLVLN